MKKTSLAATFLKIKFRMYTKKTACRCIETWVPIAFSEIAVWEWKSSWEIGQKKMRDFHKNPIQNHIKSKSPTHYAASLPQKTVGQEWECWWSLVRLPPPLPILQTPAHLPTTTNTWSPPLPTPSSLPSNNPLRLLRLHFRLFILALLPCPLFDGTPAKPTFFTSETFLQSSPEMGSFKILQCLWRVFWYLVSSPRSSLRNWVWRSLQRRFQGSFETGRVGVSLSFSGK